MNFLCSFSGVRYIYIFILNSSDLSVSESSSGSIFDIFKGIDAKAFSKSMGDSIRFVIAMLCFIFAMLVFFWGIGFQGSFFGYRQSLAKCPSLL